MVTNTTMIEALIPRTKKRTFLSQGALIFGGSLLIAVCAKIKIPLLPVPVTMQMFAVLIIASLLGSRRGALTVLLYLSEGALGLPVFAADTGVLTFVGPTAGYLVGFVFAAYLVGLNPAGRPGEVTLPLSDLNQVQLAMSSEKEPSLECGSHAVLKMPPLSYGIYTLSIIDCKIIDLNTIRTPIFFWQCIINF